MVIEFCKKHINFVIAYYVLLNVIAALRSYSTLTKNLFYLANVLGILCEKLWNQCSLTEENVKKQNSILQAILRQRLCSPPLRWLAQPYKIFNFIFSISEEDYRDWNKTCWAIAQVIPVTRKDNLKPRRTLTVLLLLSDIPPEEPCGIQAVYA